MKIQINIGVNNIRASPTGNTQQDHCRAVKSGQWLPYQEWIQLKKLAQRRKRRLEREKMWKVMVAVTLNVGTMTGRGEEVVGIVERKKIDILCVQETRWMGQKAQETGNGYKLYYVGEVSGKKWYGNCTEPSDGGYTKSEQSFEQTDLDDTECGWIYTKCDKCICTTNGLQ